MKLFGKELTGEQTIQVCKTIVQNKGCDGCLLVSGVEKLLTEIDRLQELNAKYIEMLTSEWIKFTVEKENGVEMYSSPMPDDEQEILVSDGEIIWLDIFVNEGDEGCYFDNGREIVPNFTHWMPLPKPPKGDK